MVEIDATTKKRTEGGDAVLSRLSDYGEYKSAGALVGRGGE